MRRVHGSQGIQMYSKPNPLVARPVVTEIPMMRNNRERRGATVVSLGQL